MPHQLSSMLQLLCVRRPRFLLLECPWTRCLQIRGQGGTPPPKHLRFWAEHEDEIVLQRRKEGADFSSIATELDRTADSVRARYGRFIDSKPPRINSEQALTQHEDEVIIQRMCEGVATRLIAKELHRSLSQVRNRCSVLQFRPGVPEAAFARYSRPRSKLGALDRPEAEALIERRYGEGKTLKAIASELQCNATTVWRWFSSMGLSRKQRTGFEGKGLSDPEIQTILRRRSEGWTYPAIASELGRTMGSVRYCLRRQRILEFTRKPRRAFTPDEDQELLKLHRGGNTHSEIGKLLGRAPSVVGRRLKQLENPRLSDPPRWTTEEVEDLVTQYDRGVPIRVIAAALERDCELVKAKLQLTLVRRGRTDWSPVNPARGAS